MFNVFSDHVRLTISIYDFRPIKIWTTKKMKKISKVIYGRTHEIGFLIYLLCATLFGANWAKRAHFFARWKAQDFQWLEIDLMLSKIGNFKGNSFDMTAWKIYWVWAEHPWAGQLDGITNLIKNLTAWSSTKPISCSANEGN